ncbi:Predicted integral membrane protein [Frankineae bacterium MT45]|nr:Predicted integral membrane protein [Frankineae bacterium MT45]
MLKFILALHILTAIFAVGPLVGASTTAVRGVRAGDGGAVAASARTVRIYGYASILVVALGFGLVQDKWHIKFSDGWVIASILLWVVATAIALFLLVPALEKAATQLQAGETAAALRGQVAASGGIIGLIYAAIVFLMVYGPKH